MKSSTTYLRGQAGNDTYLIDAEDRSSWIGFEEYSYDSYDVLRFTDLTLEQVTISDNGYQDHLAHGNRIAFT